MKKSLLTLLVCSTALAAMPVLAEEKNPQKTNSSEKIETRLAPVTVTASPIQSDVTYKASTASAGTKTDTPLLETPMSVQVITEEVIDDQQALSLKDVVRNSSGVVSNAYTYYDFIQIRGFDNGYAANYRNGLQLQAITGLEPALLDRVEVVKGPASMLYGRVEPGGLVNLVTKKPQKEAAYSLQQQVGSYGLKKTTADATGKINEDGTLTYRAIGAWTQADSFTDYVQSENKVGALYTTWQPNERFELNLGFEAQDIRPESRRFSLERGDGREERIPRHHAGEKQPAAVGDRESWLQNGERIWEEGEHLHHGALRYSQFQAIAFRQERRLAPYRSQDVRSIEQNAVRVIHRTADASHRRAG